MTRSLAALAIGMVATGGLLLAAPQTPPATATAGAPDINLFFRVILSTDQGEAETALEEIGRNWKNGYASMLIDLIHQLRPDGGRMFAPGGVGGASRKAPSAVSMTSIASRTGANDLVFPNSATASRRDDGESLSPQNSLFSLNGIVRRRLLSFLEEQTGEGFGYDLDAWQRWVWSNPYDPHPEYARFKGRVLGLADARMRSLFPPRVPAAVRLDQVEWAWGGINSIPPLEQPEMLSAKDAGYLKNDHIVYGVSVNGEARAYPQRIMAWHEIVHDRVGGVEMTVVYCALTETAIPYESEVDGLSRRFGGSGLVHLSNKLLFDQQTLSLWSSLQGRPIAGTLVNRPNQQLTAHPVVTTTWKEWRAMHPDTLVLSRDTGHDRDYDEGAFHEDYAKNDRLVFATPGTESEEERKAQPRAKDEILAIRPPPTAGGDEPVPLAIAAKLLETNRVYHTEVAGERLVVVTSREGANRVFRAGDAELTRALDDNVVEDSTGGRWQVTEEALVSEADSAQRLERVAAHRSFWFGWHAQYPDATLIQ